MAAVRMVRGCGGCGIALPITPFRMILLPTDPSSLRTGQSPPLPVLGVKNGDRFKSSEEPRTPLCGPCSMTTPMTTPMR